MIQLQQIDKIRMYFEDELQIPALIPIKKKKNTKQTSEIPKTGGLDEDLMQVFARQFDQMQPQKLDNDKKPEKQSKINIRSDMMDDLQKKYSLLQEKGGSKMQDQDKDVNSKNMATKKQTQNQKSKFMVNEMMKKIDAKNVTQELNPITTETINMNIRKLDRQINELKIEGERKQNSIVTNPNNQHLRKQLQNIKNSIDRCVTIKELYNEKINLRNKISALERNVLGLKEQNQNLKIKNERDLETMDNHMHGLPCDKERQLKEELNKCKVDLKKVTEIKEKLESNVTEIVQYFKRLYDEADIARLVVVKKLKEIQEKQKKQFPGEQKLSDDSVKNYEQQLIKQSQNNDTSNIRETKTPGKPHLKNLQAGQGKQPVKQNQKLSISNVKVKTFSLEDQIKKMRDNQTTVLRGYKR